MRHISPFSAGIAVGTVIAFWHLAWVAFVALGWAKPLVDFVLRLHFLSISYKLMPFTIETAAGLVVLTFVIGGLFGVVFAVVWNWLAEGRPTSDIRSSVGAQPA
jgi:hypothetical protein